jgi:hypothetical protein
MLRHPSKTDLAALLLCGALTVAEVVAAVVEPHLN